MSSYSRRTVIFAPLALAACGFHPIYGPGTGAQALNGRVAFAPVDDLTGFTFNQTLESRLGTPQSPLFRLDTTISFEQEGLAITQDNAITRYNLTAKADFNLVRLSDGKVVLSDTIRAFTAYSATASAYATHVTARDAHNRLAVSLAEQIATRIAGSAESFGL